MVLHAVAQSISGIPVRTHNSPEGYILSITTTLVVQGMDEKVEALVAQHQPRHDLDGSSRGVRAGCALCVALAPGSASESSRGGRNVRAIATAPRPMPKEPI